MIKKLVGAAAVLLLLGGCVAVPVYESGPGYAPAPAYGYYYGPPAASFSFGYSRNDYYRHRPHRHWRGREGD